MFCIQSCYILLISASCKTLLFVVAQILLKPDGNYLYGFSYQSKSTTPRNAFGAKQYAGSTLKVSKGKVSSLICRFAFESPTPQKNFPSTNVPLDSSSCIENNVSIEERTCEVKRY